MKETVPQGDEAWSVTATESALFRPEVIENQRKRLYGHVLDFGRIPASYCLVPLVGIAVIAVFTATLTYQENVTGRIVRTPTPHAPLTLELSERATRVLTAGDRVAVLAGSLRLEGTIQSVERQSCTTGEPCAIAEIAGVGHASNAWAAGLRISVTGPKTRLVGEH